MSLDYHFSKHLFQNCILLFFVNVWSTVCVWHLGHWSFWSWDIWARNIWNKFTTSLGQRRCANVFFHFSGKMTKKNLKKMFTMSCSNINVIVNWLKSTMAKNFGPTYKTAWNHNFKIIFSGQYMANLSWSAL